MLRIFFQRRQGKFGVLQRLAIRFVHRVVRLVDREATFQTAIYDFAIRRIRILNFAFLVHGKSGQRLILARVILGNLIALRRFGFIERIRTRRQA